MQFGSERGGRLRVDEEISAHRNNLLFFPELEAARGVGIGSERFSSLACGRLRIGDRRQIFRTIFLGRGAAAIDRILDCRAPIALRISDQPQLQAARQMIESQQRAERLLAGDHRIGPVGAPLVKRPEQPARVGPAVAPRPIQIPGCDRS